MVDATDLKILRYLCEDGRVAYSHIAKELHLSDVAVKKRVEKLIARGIIKKIKAELDYEKIGYKYIFFMEIKPDPAEITTIYEELKNLPNVLEIHVLVGDYPILVKALAENVNAIRNFVEKVGKMSGVMDVKTSISLKWDEKEASIPQSIFQTRLG